ncbi:hypothetical protein F5B19DRAFT_503459 [Rostrohypoxylon terebratum]|nr:hypothetical protein F5B19DRAFT_503459 [Rostrohypoxylon terebratum]
MYHLALHSQCGICANIIFRNEPVIALFGNEDSTSYRGQTRPFLFPDVEPTITIVDGFQLCRRPNCKICATSPHFIPVHCDVLERLWTVAAWRSPWRRARPIYLFRNQPDLNSNSLRAIGQICQLPQLCQLPIELLVIIHGYSEHALLWRAVSAHSLASHMSSTNPEPLTMMPLGGILFWERGGKLEKCCDSSSSRMTIMRLTIDSKGISKIESAPDHFPKDASHVRFAHIVEQKQTLGQLTVQFKCPRLIPFENGLLRLVLPTGQPTPRIWNTLDPPDLSRCTPYISAFPSWQRFYAVDTGRIVGITFFFCSGRLFGIHPHYSNTDAMPTYCRFSHSRQRGIVWVYQPIAKHDRLLVFGVRESSQRELGVLFRFERTGDVAIGSYIPGPAKDRCLGCGLSSRKLRLNPFHAQAYFSRAPLVDITSAGVFYDEDNQLCKGIIFRYHDGACRAVGQCRVHIDATTWVCRPRRLWYRIHTRDLRHRVIYSLQVTLQEAPIHQQEGWRCHQLEGMLNFWFTPDSSFITIEN